MTRLSRKFNQINILILSVVLLIASVVYYFTLRYYQDSEADEDLVDKKQEILAYIGKENALPFAKEGGRLSTTFRLIPETSPYDRFLTKDYPGTWDYRCLVFTVEVKGLQYEVTIRKSLEDFIELFAFTMVVMFIMLSILLIVITTANSILFKALLRPFFAALDTIKSFRVNARQPVVFPATDINEFRQLNAALEYAISKATKDYRQQREFIENAAHELQTPLSVIRSKLELIIQEKEVSEKQFNAASAAFNALTRLAGLNKSLLLLTKIENGYFNITGPLDVGLLIQERLADFSDLVSMRQITVTVQQRGALIVPLNLQLGEILLNNLVSNAIEHNIIGGLLNVVIDVQSLKISNTGNAADMPDRAIMFQRFARQRSATAKTGLGLAIIQEICKVSGITIDYDYSNGQHQFSLSWQQ